MLFRNSYVSSFKIILLTITYITYDNYCLCFTKIFKNYIFIHYERSYDFKWSYIILKQDYNNMNLMWLLFVLRCLLSTPNSLNETLIQQGPHYKRISSRILNFKCLYRLFEMTYNWFSFYFGLVLNVAFRKKVVWIPKCLQRRRKKST